MQLRPVDTKLPETVTATGSPTRPAGASDDALRRTDPVDGGDVLRSGRCGRYEVLGMVGSGGMGVVFEARDPVLDRKVALKLLRPRRHLSAADNAERLAVEARAMARLAHPNVVTVFEIDWVDAHVYVAMELVAGTTLRGWLHDRPRRWREIVEMFVAAGRGLAAAHAAGLVHRDFKPDNVLIGADGRPRVTDFGLVVGAGDDDGEDLIAAAAQDGDATLRGGTAGTPAYMSAEQWTGKPIDARSDQFAFCVALWEALYRRRPFAGARAREIRDAVCAGTIAEPSKRDVPRWLLAMLRRGLAHDPEARWPDMTALLDALVRRIRAQGRWAAAAITAGIAIASAAVAATVVASREAPDPCAPPTDRLARMWGPVRGQTVRTHLAAIDPAHGLIRFSKIASVFDAAADSWSAMHVAACRATRVEGRQSDTLLDRRMECLDRWLGELGDTVRIVEQAASPAAVDQSIHAATALSPLDVCANTRALAEVLPPASAADRLMASALVDRTRELDVAQRASRLDGLAAKAADLVAAARALGHAPTLAGALAMQVRLRNALGERAATEPLLRELVDVAARVHDDRDEAFAWMQLLALLTYSRGKPDDALVLVPVARAAVLRAGEPIDLRADLLYHQAIVFDYGSRPAEGVVLLEEERRLLEQAGATSPGSPLASRLGDVLYETGESYLRADNLERAITAAHESIARWRAVSGVDSADEAFSWLNLSVALQRAGRLDEALDAATQAVRLREARLGDSVSLALTLVVQAGVLDEHGRFAESLPIYDRALRMSRATMAPGDLGLGDPLIDRGVALVHLGRFDEAVRDYDEAIALFERVGGKTINLPLAVYNRADVALRRGRCEDAIRDDLRAIQLFEAVVPPTAYQLLYPLSGEGACLVRLGRPAEAIAVLERALRCKASGADAFEVARAKAYLGRARVETGRDVAGGLAMARAARPGIAASADGAEELRMLDRWLAGHAR
jgi:tetratricopeptide (TPR) repeat protein